MLIDIRKAIRPLRFIFWGSLFYVLDLKIGTSGLKIDLFDDTLGMCFIVYGILKLECFFVYTQHQHIFSYIKYAAIFIAIGAFIQNFIDYTILNLILSIISIIMIVLFCGSMIWLSKRYNMYKSSMLWEQTKVLYASIYLLIYSIFIVYSFIQMLGIPIDKPIRTNNILIAIIGLFIMSIPFFYFLKSTSHMAREAEQIRITDTDILASLLLNGDYINIKRA